MILDDTVGLFVVDEQTVEFPRESWFTKPQIRRLWSFLCSGLWTSRVSVSSDVLDRVGFLQITRVINHALASTW